MPTSAQLKAEVEARELVLELRRALWPNWPQH
jgi:hypothetical protein